MSRRPTTETDSKAVQCILTPQSSSEAVPSSGRTENDTSTSVIPDISPTLSIDLDELCRQQSADEYLSKVMAWLERSNNRPPLGCLKHSSPALRKLWHECPKLTRQNGIPCRKVKPGPQTSPSFQVVLPEVFIPTALKGMHGNQFSGHLSTLYKEPDALVTGHTCLVTFTSFSQVLALSVTGFTYPTWKTTTAVNSSRPTIPENCSRSHRATHHGTRK